MAEVKKTVLAQDGVEVWEMQTNGRVWVESTTDKNRGVTKMKSVQGKGSRLRITTEDRKLAQERIREVRHDPFTNGLMMRIDSDQQADPETASPSAVDDATLAKILTYKQAARFTAAIEDLTEISLRRLWDIAEQDDDISGSQKKQISEYLNSKFGVNRGKEDRRHMDARQVAETFPVMKLSS